MTKVVINQCYGGFSLSGTAVALLQKRFPELDLSPGGRDIPRHHPGLVAVVEELGSHAASGHGQYAQLAVVSTHERHYRIHEYDGLESLETPGSVGWISAADD